MVKRDKWRERRSNSGYAPQWRTTAQIDFDYYLCVNVYCIVIWVQTQLSPHVLIQSMRTSFCIYRLINRQNKGYNYQIWAIGAGNELLGVILSDGGSRSPALLSLLIPIFRGRNQRFIKKCTLRWTIAGYRPTYPRKRPQYRKNPWKPTCQNFHLRSENACRFIGSSLCAPALQKYTPRNKQKSPLEIVFRVPLTWIGSRFQ